MPARRAGRRDFLKRGTGAVAAAVLAGRGRVLEGAEGQKPSRVRVVLDPADAVAAAPPVRWAAGQLGQALAPSHVAFRIVDRLDASDESELTIVASGKPSSSTRDIALPDAAEAFTITAGEASGAGTLFARGRDVRGLVYALTELADTAALADDPAAALLSVEPRREQPANPVRSCMRLFCSDVEDKPWFNDRAFWRSYLSMLATQRFNRFNLALGLGYDFAREIRDAYLHFAYPFLVAVPGYAVRATNLPDDERDANLEMLRFISDETAARGLHFQLGLWTHAYEWIDSPEANHRIEGLTAENHAAYCRDALALVLKECPRIGGVTLRTHGESGVSEGSYEFWRTVFDGVTRAGRPVEIDLHAKGLDQRTIDLALATGQKVIVSPKYWAEHMGLPYHQAWIRPTELPQRERGEGLFANSSGARSFLRYGYGDLLAEDRRYGIVHRLWPGTQRMLLWGDPVFAAAYGRASSLAGSLGTEVMEPLSFKGRKGSGHKGRRTAEAEDALATPRDFEKYLHTYRLWGRLLYDPEAKPEGWRRLLRRHYGPAAPAVEETLAQSGRILPLFTTAHTPSAANNHYWPEMYVNMSIVDASHPEPFTDTPTPKRFGAVSPLDPQLFSRIDDFAGALVDGPVDGRYSPAEVARDLDSLATAAADRLAEARRATTDRHGTAFRRFTIDATVQVELGRFFANKLRSGVLFALFERTGDRGLLAEAVRSYRSAREAWGRIVIITKNAYVSDVSYGIAWYQRGHWSDRVPAIDADIAAMEAKAPATEAPAAAELGRLTEVVLHPPPRPGVAVQHTPPTSFRRGQPVTLAVEAKGADALRLLYRRMNQAEAWRTEEMKPSGGAHRAEVPGDYTDSPFPLQYYFELKAGTPPRAWLHPGFNATWSNMPYFVVRAGR